MMTNTREEVVNENGNVDHQGQGEAVHQVMLRTASVEQHLPSSSSSSSSSIPSNSNNLNFATNTNTTTNIATPTAVVVQLAQPVIVLTGGGGQAGGGAVRETPPDGPSSLSFSCCTSSNKKQRNVAFFVGCCFLFVAIGIIIALRIVTKRSSSSSLPTTTTKHNNKNDDDDDDSSKFDMIYDTPLYQPIPLPLSTTSLTISSANDKQLHEQDKESSFNQNHLNQNPSHVIVGVNDGDKFGLSMDIASVTTITTSSTITATSETTTTTTTTTHYFVVVGESIQKELVVNHGDRVRVYHYYEIHNDNNVPSSTSNTSHYDTRRNNNNNRRRWKQVGNDLIGDWVDDGFGRSVSISAFQHSKTYYENYDNNDKNTTIPNANTTTNKNTTIITLRIACGSPDKGIAGVRSGLLRVFEYNVTISDVDIDDVLTEEEEEDGFDNERKNTTNGVRQDEDNNQEANDWIQIGQDLVGINALDQFATKVALNKHDGSILVGSSTQFASANGGKGKGYVLVYGYNSITQVWDPLHHYDDTNHDSDATTTAAATTTDSMFTGEQSGDLYGDSISISGNGKVLAVGSPMYQNSTGNVQIYKRNDDGKESDVNNDGWIRYNEFVLDDGDDDDNDDKLSTTTTSSSSILQGDRPGDFFGTSVSLNYDGTCIVIGAKQGGTSISSNIVDTTSTGTGTGTNQQQNYGYARIYCLSSTVNGNDDVDDDNNNKSMNKNKKIVWSLVGNRHDMVGERLRDGYATNVAIASSLSSNSGGDGSTGRCTQQNETKAMIVAVAAPRAGGGSGGIETSGSTINGNNGASTGIVYLYEYTRRNDNNNQNATVYWMKRKWKEEESSPSASRTTTRNIVDTTKIFGMKNGDQFGSSVSFSSTKLPSHPNSNSNNHDIAIACGAPFGGSSSSSSSNSNNNSDDDYDDGSGRAGHVQVYKLSPIGLTTRAQP